MYYNDRECYRTVVIKRTICRQRVGARATGRGGWQLEGDILQGLVMAGSNHSNSSNDHGQLLHLLDREVDTLQRGG